MLDREWRYVYVNAAGAAAFGRTPDQLVGKHIWTEFPDGVGQPFHRAYERAMATQEPVVLEDYYEPWDRWFENRIYPSPDALTIFYHEITGRKRAEIDARDAAELLRLTIEGTGTGLFEWDLRTNAVRYSREWKAQLGLAQDEVANDFEEWRSRVHPEDLDSAMARIRAFLATPQPGFENEFRMRHRDGSWRHILSRAHVVRDGHGEPLRLIGLHIDITQRKLNELLLEALNRVLEMVALGATLSDVLDALAKSVEKVVDGAIATVLLLDESGQRVRHGAAPGLSDSFAQAIDGQAIGPAAGSCGTAMYRGAPVFTRDIETDTLWDPYREVARAHGLRSCWSTPIKDAQGTVLGSFALYWREPKEPGSVQLHSVDTATRVAAIAIGHARQELAIQRAHDALRESEVRARRIFEEANDPIHLVSADGRFLDVNNRAAEMLGYSRAEFLEMRVEDIVPPEERVRLVPTSHDITWVPLVTEWHHVRKDGSRVPVEVSSRKLADGTFLAIVRDLSERRRHLEALKASFERIRQLAAGTERVREAERRRISREIHDELGQALTGLKMDLAWISQRISDPASSERADVMQRLLDDTVVAVRRIASELRPGILDDLGLAAALRWLGREFERRTGIGVSISVSEFIAADDEIATAAFRIAQEALTNVARHAQATAVTLSASVSENVLRLEVTDNGRGLHPAAAGGTGTLGVMGMRERAEAWGGDFAIETATRGGTAVRARLPLTAAAPHGFVAP